MPRPLPSKIPPTSTRNAHSLASSPIFVLFFFQLYCSCKTFLKSTFILAPSDFTKKRTSAVCNLWKHSLFLANIYDTAKIHPHRWVLLQLICLDSCVIFHCVVTSQRIHPFPYWWASGLLPAFCCCAQKCCDHSCTHLPESTHRSFSRVYTSAWNQLGCRVCGCGTLAFNSRLFPKMPASICIPTVVDEKRNSECLWYTSYQELRFLPSPWVSAPYTGRKRWPNTTNYSVQKPDLGPRPMWLSNLALLRLGLPTPQADSWWREGAGRTRMTLQSEDYIKDDTPVGSSLGSRAEAQTLQARLCTGSSLGLRIIFGIYFCSRSLSPFKIFTTV